MVNLIQENELIGRLVAQFPRSPRQINHLHESDAELLDISSHSGLRLAITTDTIAEEIESGLYADPWLIGWMTVMVNLSDLAAVGASPLGVLLAETLPREATEEFLRQLQQGIADACAACGTYVLGGDTNTGTPLSMTATAVGIVEGDRLLTRVGCSPGDVVFVSGSVGGGSALAYAHLTRSPLPPYRPRARVCEGRLLRAWATCCMDTSDGLLATLDQLMRLNNAGFALDPGWAVSLDDAARTLAEKLRVPGWFTIAGEHGEFELVFTVSEEQVPEFLERTRLAGWTPFRIGKVIPEREIRISVDMEYSPDGGAPPQAPEQWNGRPGCSCNCTGTGGDARATPVSAGRPARVPPDDGYVRPNTTAIRNLGETARRDLNEYLQHLRRIAAEVQSPTDL